MRGRNVGEGDVVVPDAPQTRQDLQDEVKRLKKTLGLYLGKGGDDEVLSVPGGEGDEDGLESGRLQLR